MSQSDEKTDFHQKVGSSILWNTLLVPLLRILPLVSSVIIVRGLGAETYGTFVLISGIVSSLALCTDLGLRKSTPKFFPEVKQRLGQEGLAAFLFGIMALRFGASILVSLALLLWPGTVIKIFDFGEEGGRYLFFIVSMLIIESIKGSLAPFLVADLRNKELNIIQLIIVILRPVSLMSVILLGYGLIGLLVASVCVSILNIGLLQAAVIRIVNLRTLGQIKIRQFFRIMGWRYLKYNIMLYIIRITQYFSDIGFIALILGIWGYKTELAYIAIAFKLAKMTQEVVLSPLNQIKTPLLARAFVDRSHQRLRHTYRWLIKLTILLIIPSGFGLFFVGTPVVGYLYGQEYLTASVYIWVIVAGLWIASLLSTGNSVLTVYENYKWLIISTISSFLVALSLFVVPRSGLSLLLVVMSIKLTWVSLSLAFAIHLYKLKFPGQFLLKIGLASAVIIATGFFIRPQTPPLLLLAYVAGGALSFWGLLKLQGGLDVDERRLITQAKLSPKLEKLLLRIL